MKMKGTEIIINYYIVNIVTKGQRIKLNCEFCKDAILANLRVYRFANYERFFCCTVCVFRYKNKYAGRIESIKRRFKDEDKFL
jgi:hypothetical protein